MQPQSIQLFISTSDDFSCPLVLVCQAGFVGLGLVVVIVAPALHFEVRNGYRSNN